MAEPANMLRRPLDMRARGRPSSIISFDSLRYGLIDCYPVNSKRHFPIGAELSLTGADFRVWAPGRRTVAVQLQTDGASPIPLLAEPDGYFSGFASGASAGMRYRLQLDDGEPLP